MPRVPYSGVPEIAATDRPIPGMRVNAPVEAFGGATAAATTRLGGTVEAAGNELFTRALAMQQLANTTEASEANVNFMIDAGKLHAQYGALQGKAAVDGYDGYVKSLQDLQKKVGDGLSNPMSRRMYDQESRGTMARTIFNAAGHAATENKQWSIGTANDELQLKAKGVEDNPTDEVGFQRTKNEVKALASHSALLSTGAEPGSPQDELAQRQAVSKVVSSKLIGLSKTQPLTAWDAYEKEKVNLFGDDQNRTEQTLLVAKHNVGSRMIAANVNSDLYDQSKPGLPEKTLDDRVKEAREIAEKQFPNDPVMVENVTTAVRTGYSNYKHDIADAEYRNLTTVQDQLQTNIGGKLPTTLDELFVSDKARQAYIALPPVKLTQVRHALELTAKGDVAETDATYQQFYRWKGMATSDDPKDRAEFMDKFFPADGTMPRSRRDQLAKVQDAMKKKGEVPPHIMEGMRVLTDAGIAPRTADDKEGALQFRGALQEAVDALREDGKPAPKTLDEWKKIGSVLRAKVSGTGWFGSNVGSQKIFELSVPSDALEQYKAAFPNMSDDQARLEYGKLRFKEQWNQLYGKKQ